MFFSQELLTSFSPKFAPRIYMYTGGFQTFKVPFGIRKVKVAVAGVRGVGGNGSIKGIGGNGGRVECELKTIPGEILYIYVGQYIASSDDIVIATYNASDIRTNNAGITDNTSLQSRLVVAGAGGNGGTTYNADFAGQGGAGGGLVGGTGVSEWDISGRGGTQTSGGAGGVGPQQTGYSGAFGIGGNGSGYSGIFAGAGGAGWYGGGGGGAKTTNSPYNVGGGGGGSSYTNESRCSDVVHTQGTITGEGYVKIWAVGDSEPGVEPGPTPTEYESQFSASWDASTGSIGTFGDLTKDYGLDILPSTTYNATIEQIGFNPTTEWYVMSGMDYSTYAPIPVSSLVVGGTFTFTTADSDYNILRFGSFGENVPGSIVLGINREGYPSGTVLFESGEPGTYTLNVEKKCTVRLDMCGGGGNGSMLHRGGSSGYIYGNTEIGAGTYEVVVGSFGGGSSSFNENIAGGGGNAGSHSDGSGGVCTVVSAGLTGSNGSSGSTTSRILSYGGGGDYSSSSHNGQNGYVKIEVV